MSPLCFFHFETSHFQLCSFPLTSPHTSTFLTVIILILPHPSHFLLLSLPFSSHLAFWPLCSLHFITRHISCSFPFASLPFTPHFLTLMFLPHPLPSHFLLLLYLRPNTLYLLPVFTSHTSHLHLLTLHAAYLPLTLTKTYYLSLLTISLLHASTSS